MQLIEGIEFSSNDVGLALEILEFFSAFEQVCTFLSKMCFKFISMVQSENFESWRFSFILS